MVKSTGTDSQTSNEKRDAIIREAYSVFYIEGFHASGVDRAIEGTGISKRTLYKYFASKEELIEATIAHYSEQQARRFEEHFTRNKSRSPIDRALSIFDWLTKAVEEGQAFGCFATNAKVEYSKKNPGIEAACDMHFGRFESLFVDLCRDCGVKNLKKTAGQFQIVFQGAIMSSQTRGDLVAIQNAKAVARMVLENAS